METGIVMAAAALGGITLGFYTHRARRRGQRSGELGELAAELGWRFDRRRDFRHDDRYAAFEVFRRGSAGMARDTLWGSFSINGVEYPAKAGDFVYFADHPVTGSVRARYSARVEFSYLVVHLPFRDPIDLRVAPTGSMPGPGEPLGAGELAFEHGDFRRIFEVRCSSPDFADRLFDRELRRLLIATRCPTIEVIGGRLCLADGRRRWTPDEFRAGMKIAGEIVSRWSAAGDP
jgi:hypothetical protein